MGNPRVSENPSWCCVRLAFCQWGRAQWGDLPSPLVWVDGEQGAAVNYLWVGGQGAEVAGVGMLGTPLPPQAGQEAGWRLRHFSVFPFPFWGASATGRVGGKV